jgi:hypothetical protein
MYYLSQKCSRTCESCQRIFATAEGLKKHQGYKQNPACNRLSFKKKQKAMKAQQDTYRNLKPEGNQPPNSIRHPKNIPYHKLQKMTCINVLNWFFTLLSLSIVQAQNLAGEACGLPLWAVKRFCREYQTFGAFGTKFRSQYRRSDAFEKLTFDQKEGFQLQIHDEFRKFASGEINVPNLKSIHKRLMKDPTLPRMSLKTTAAIMKR